MEEQIKEQNMIIERLERENERPKKIMEIKESMQATDQQTQQGNKVW